MKTLFTMIILCLTSLSATGQTTTPVPADTIQTSDPNLVPLTAVISQVKDAVAEYQKDLGAGQDALPPLTTAEFEFKTTVATTLGGGVNLFIFKIGVSHEKDDVNDVAYTYSVPKPPGSAGLASNRKAPLLKDELAKTIQSAAAAVKANGKFGKLPFSKLTVTLQYAVKWDATGGASIPVELITINLSGERSKNTLQSIKLVFGQ